MKYDTDCYWINLMRIKEKFPGREELNQKETAEYVGIFYTKIRKYFKFIDNKINITALAKKLS